MGRREDGEEVCCHYYTDRAHMYTEVDMMGQLRWT